MDIGDCIDLLSRINGCTFATLDAETSPSPGIKAVTTSLNALLFTNHGGSGYERMVKRRLVDAGKNPDNFVLSDLPWGSRVDGTPLIVHKGVYYLQCVVLSGGDRKYYIMGREINPEDFGLEKRHTNQGLPEGSEVLVNTFDVRNITRLSLLGDRVEAA